MTDEARESRRPRKARGAFASGPLLTRDAALFTDLYQLTMAASYLARGDARSGDLQLVRPDASAASASFLVAAGLEDVLNFLRDFRFSDDALVVSRLARPLRFRLPGIPSPAALHRPGPGGARRHRGLPERALARGHRPIIEAQLVETAVLNLVHFQTLLASKAARCVLAARGRPVIEFGLRRTHGVDAGMKAARCAFIAGAAMSSNVLAGLSYGIPPTGTMAHSYVSAFPARSTPFAPSPAHFPGRVPCSSIPTTRSPRRGRRWWWRKRWKPGASVSPACGWTAGTSSA